MHIKYIGEFEFRTVRNLSRLLSEQHPIITVSEEGPTFFCHFRVYWPIYSDRYWSELWREPV